MRYARVVIYKAKSSAMEESISMARDGLVKLFRRLPGFCSYYVVTNTDGRGVSIAEFETKAQSEEAIDRARMWVQANIGDRIEIEQSYTAPVQIEETEDGTALVRKLYDLFNAKEFDRVDECARSDAVMEVLPFGAASSFREEMEAWASTFPDGQIEVRSITGNGHTVCAECVGRGTHTGPFAGPEGTIEATNKKVELRFCDIYRVENGKITSGRMYFDQNELFDQIRPEVETRETVPSAWMMEWESRTLH